MTNEQKSRIKSAGAQSQGAHVIFIDFEEKYEQGIDDVTQIGAIVFTGIAYLNNDDNAFMLLYRLLTGQRHELVTIESLRKNPGLLIFILAPASIHNYSDLKRLNDLMEREILKAA